MRERPAKLPTCCREWGCQQNARHPGVWRPDGKKLGVAPDVIKSLKGKIDHPLPPRRRLRPRSADEEPVVGQHRRHRSMIEFAQAIDAGHVHHVSSIARPACMPGVFREDMLTRPRTSITPTS